MHRLLDRFNKKPVSWHAPLLQEIAQIVKPGVYAELGIYEGETFNLVNADLKIAVDINSKSLEYIKSAENSVKICGNSLALCHYLDEADIQLDMLFIDADHRKESVVQDFGLLEQHLSEKALVFFHDTYPLNEQMASPSYCGDSYLAIPELRADYKNWNFITLPVHPGLTIATRVNHMPAWTKTKGV